MKKIALAVLLTVTLRVFAQVEIDKSISLTSPTPADAKISGIKSVSDAQDAVSVETLQSGRLAVAATVSGTDAISLGFTPAITVLQAGMMLSFKATGGNTTTTVTIDVDGAGPLAAQPLRKNVADALAIGDILINQMVSVIYDGLAFQLLGSRLPSASANYVQNRNVDAAFGSGQSASFDITGNAEINGTLNVNGAVGIGVVSPFNKMDIAGTLGMRDNDIYFRGTGNLDVNHGVGFYGGTKLFKGQNINGPVLYGCSGGALGTSSCIANNIALYWNSTGNVGVGGNVLPIQTLDVNGRINVTNGVIQRGATAITATSDLGLYSGIDGNWIRFVTTNSDFAWYNDGGIGTSNTMRLDRFGGLTVYGLAGTGNRPVFADATGKLKAGSKAVAYVVDRNQRTYSSSNTTYVTASNSTNALAVETGDVIVINVTLKFAFTGGSGGDDVRFRLNITGCANTNQSDSFEFEDFDNNRDEYEPVALQYVYVATCNGNLQFNLEMDAFSDADDNVKTADCVIVATRY